MDNITIITAIGKNNEIGKDNKLLWHIPEDLNFFKEHTIGKNIVMGKNTLISIGTKLKERNYIILTHQDINIENIKNFKSFEELLLYIKNTKDEEFMIIGGESIYKQFINYADKMLITKIDKEYDADTYFPQIDKNVWNEEVLSEEEYKDIKYKHLIYKRNK